MATTNNALNNQSATSVASTTQTFVVSNTDNTGTSAAQVQVSVGGGTTSGDPQTSYIVTGATTWSVGADNSVSDQFVIATSATLGTSNAQTITTAGVVSWPLQPTFLVFLPSNVTNATGTGTVWTFGTTTALTKVFDVGTNITTAGVFTAPATGQYYFCGNIELSNCTVNTGIQIQFVTTARTYQNKFNRTAANTTNAMSLSTIADMTSGDTATMTVAGFGEAGDTNTVDGTGGGLICYFGGFLMG